MSLKKITVVGAGNVGSEAANLLASREIANIVLIDKMGDWAKGKALDIKTSAVLKNSTADIIGGDDYKLTENSDIVIITAGMPRKPGMSREELLEANTAIITDITGNIKKYSPDAIIIMVTNPLDVMTYLAYKVSGFRSEKVIGMAGVLDTARFKTFIAEELNISVKDINAMVLGGHGDEMVPLVNSATVSGIPLKQLLDDKNLERLVERTRKGGAEIVSLLKTGSAYYAPAVSAVEMAEAIIKDRKSLMPVSVLLNGQYGINDIYLGVPAIIGEKGVEKVSEYKIEEQELAMLQKSASMVKENIKKLEEIMSITQ